MPTSCIGDLLTPHCCGPVCHPGSIASGSSKVMVGGRPLAKIGDFVNCGSILITGSTKVRVEEAVPAISMPTQVTTSDGTVVQLAPSYSSEAVTPLIQSAGKYAVFDDPDK